jgi:hypothetical protein
MGPALLHWGLFAGLAAYDMRAISHRESSPCSSDVTHMDSRLISAYEASPGPRSFKAAARPVRSSLKRSRNEASAAVPNRRIRWSTAVAEVNRETAQPLLSRRKRRQMEQDALAAQAAAAGSGPASCSLAATTAHEPQAARPKLRVLRIRFTKAQLPTVALHLPASQTRAAQQADGRKSVFAGSACQDSLLQVAHANVNRCSCMRRLLCLPPAHLQLQGHRYAARVRRCTAFPLTLALLPPTRPWLCQSPDVELRRGTWCGPLLGNGTCCGRESGSRSRVHLRCKDGHGHTASSPPYSPHLPQQQPSAAQHSVSPTPTAAAAVPSAAFAASLWPPRSRSAAALGHPSLPQPSAQLSCQPTPSTTLPTAPGPACRRGPALPFHVLQGQLWQLRRDVKEE